MKYVCFYTVTGKYQLPKTMYRNELHRLDGHAILWSDGSKEWYKNGKRHRINGPAVDLNNGRKDWYINGIHHNLSGPAVIWREKYEYFINGEKLNKKEVENWIKENNIDLNKKTYQIIFLLRFG